MKKVVHLGQRCATENAEVRGEATEPEISSVSNRSASAPWTASGAVTETQAAEGSGFHLSRW
jgi:hypothetical protein